MGGTPLFTPAGTVPPVMRKSKHGRVQAEGVEGATADIRLFSLPPCRLRRGEIPASRLHQACFFSTQIPFTGISCVPDSTLPVSISS